jgi:multidrug resistance efflux pump
MIDPKLITKDSNIHPSVQKINSLKSEIMEIEKSNNNLILAFQNLAKENLRKRADENKLSATKNYLISERDKLLILAPFDGLIGNINCKEKEFIPSQTTLVAFYESSPSSAIAYIHESLSVGINIGDSLIITSTLRPGRDLGGIIMGKGHRIVEIPERLRKIAEYKMYGMEVYIRLSAPNDLLQKEMIRIQTLQ